MREATHVSRRKFVGLLLAGAGALVTACGTPTPAPVVDSAVSQAGPAVAPASVGAANVVIPSRSTGADPLGAVAQARQTTPTALRAISLPISITATPQATDTPAATAIAEATNTTVPTATATPFPYDASRLTDLLGESITSYAGSIAPRVHNVRLATSLINGAQIAPGAVFSFDERVGDQTTAHGFQVAWGIITSDGKPETVHADAGGICQVATTVFQALYWAGLPIVQRYHHLYWIAHYGTPPYGGIGLDATVDFPPVDLKVKNSTSDWVRIDASYDATHVHVRVVGVSQGWKVSSSQPKIENMVKTDPTPVRRPDPTMNPGTELWVEAAQDGFDVTIERLVKSSSGDLVDRYVFKNHYDQAQNVLVFGTKGLTPTVTPPAGTPTIAAPLGTATPTLDNYRLPDGRIKVPPLVGLTEAQARQLVSQVSLQNTFSNYQGPGDVPAAALNQVPVGAVLSQLPPPGTVVGPGTTVYLAVRKA